MFIFTYSYNIESLNRYQISLKSYAADTCTPIKVKGKEFSELSRFRILPEQNYKFNQEYLNLGEIASTETQNSLQLRVQSEFEQNIAALELKKNQNVRLEDAVQFYHEPTKRYMCIFEEESKFVLGLSKYPSKFTHFKLEPAFLESNKRANQIFLVWEGQVKLFLKFQSGTCIFSTADPEPLQIKKLATPMGSEKNRVQEDLKYVYMKVGEDPTFLYPCFEDSFSQTKIDYYGLKEFTGFTALDINLVWRWELTEEGFTTFTHISSGAKLWFDPENKQFTQKYEEDSKEEGVNKDPNLIGAMSSVLKSTEQNQAFRVVPTYSELSIEETLTAGTSFYLWLDKGSEDENSEYLVINKSDSDTSNSKERSDDTKICLGANTNSDKWIFTLVKLNPKWKEEVDYALSISAYANQFYTSTAGEDSKENNFAKESRSKSKETLKLFKNIKKYIFNQLEDYKLADYQKGELVKSR